MAPVWARLEETREILDGLEGEVRELEDMLRRDQRRFIKGLEDALRGTGGAEQTMSVNDGQEWKDDDDPYGDGSKWYELTECETELLLSKGLASWDEMSDGAELSISKAGARLIRSLRENARIRKMSRNL